MAILEGLEPVEVFHYFEELSQIPRATFHTKAVSDYCVAFAKERGLFVIQDEMNNVIIRKPGTVGYESSEPVILQGHLDMVCEKTEDSGHDFMKDGLKLFVEDGFVKAEDTTLGADNGIAVAMALAVLDNKDIPHPPVEVLLTVDEEMGMGGAGGVDLTPLEGRMLLNLDSDVEGTIIAGCAGGVTIHLTLPVTREKVGGTCLDISIRGLRGGHSGIEIDRQRGNANKLAGRLLNKLTQKADISLVNLKGGTKENVITPFCHFTVAARDASEVEQIVHEALHTWRQEFGNDEPELDITVTPTGEKEAMSVSYGDMKKIVLFLNSCQNGVYGFSRSLEGLVETSDNLGIVHLEKDSITFVVLARGSVNSRLEELRDAFVGWADLLGADCEISGEYPGWAYKEDSKIRTIVSEAFEKLYGREPKITTVHAGLECGILSGKKQELDCVSFGPFMYDIHSVKERLDIASTKRTWDFLKEILKACK